MNIQSLLAASIIVLSTSANAEGRADKICSYRPSAVLGGSGATVVSAAGAGTATVGMGANAAGFYTLTHAVTGATMLGSTAGGASAAGTVGIMGGTAGVVGGVAAFVTAPATIITGAVVGVGIGVYEGGCYFADKRVTDFDEILEIMQDIEQTADAKLFMLIEDPKTGDWYISLRGVSGYDNYNVADLYLVNGVLMNRDWFKNTTIGNLNFITLVDQ